MIKNILHYYYKLANLTLCSIIMMSNPVYAADSKVRYIAAGVVNVDSLKYAQNIKHTPVDMNKDDMPEYVLEITQGKVYEDGIILTDDDKLVEDVIVLGYNKSIHKHRLLTMQKSSESSKYMQSSERIAVIASSGAENYYHWMLQIIPRIKILQSSGVKWDKLYFFDMNKKYQFDSLAQLGINKEQIIVGEPDQILQAQTLIVPSIPVLPMHNKILPHWVATFLQSQFLSKDDFKFPQKIFISRAHASKRRIINEEQIMQPLILLGFTKVELEKLSIVQQAALFHQAKVIIGAHGSGLTNLVYCNPKAQLIEINIPEGHNGPFKGMARILGINYVDVATNPLNLSQQQIDDEDIYVDISNLLNIVKTKQ